MSRRAPTTRDCQNYHAVRFELTGTEYCREKNLTYAIFTTMYAQWKRDRGLE